MVAEAAHAPFAQNSAYRLTLHFYFQVFDGKTAELVVRAIEFQPEASGDYTA